MQFRSNKTKQIVCQNVVLIDYNSIIRKLMMADPGIKLDFVKKIIPTCPLDFTIPPTRPGHSVWLISTVWNITIKCPVDLSWGLFAGSRCKSFQSVCSHAATIAHLHLLIFYCSRLSMVFMCYWWSPT